MATITQTSKYVLDHPFTKQACEKLLVGDTKDLKFILDLLQLDIYQETAINCAKAFKRHKLENYPIVESAIREVEPPLKLNTKLPTPPPRPACVVVPFKLKKVLKSVVKATGQLKFEFKFA
jgi:hypothetical protein